MTFDPQSSRVIASSSLDGTCQINFWDLVATSWSGAPGFEGFAALWYSYKDSLAAEAGSGGPGVEWRSAGIGRRVAEGFYS